MLFSLFRLVFSFTNPQQKEIQTSPNQMMGIGQIASSTLNNMFAGQDGENTRLARMGYNLECIKKVQEGQQKRLQQGKILECLQSKINERKRILEAFEKTTSKVDSCVSQFSMKNLKCSIKKVLGNLVHQPTKKIISTKGMNVLRADNINVAAFTIDKLPYRLVISPPKEDPILSEANGIVDFDDLGVVVKQTGELVQPDENKTDDKCAQCFERIKKETVDGTNMCAICEVPSKSLQSAVLNTITADVSERNK